jgi:elongation factor Ts
MATITASLVNDLRNKTGLGMMECKKMLEQTGGDVEQAIAEFRKKGVKTSITERAANEGRVFCATAPDKSVAAAVEINCNTDFTAKSDAVAKVVEKAVQKLLANPMLHLAEDEEIKTELTALAKQTGENVVLGRSATLRGSGSSASYLYSTSGKGKVAVLMGFSGPVSDDIPLNLGMHIAAAKPIAHERKHVDADLVAKEREIAVEQAKATGKPQQIAEKIAEGKLNSFFAERVLVDQEFIRADYFKGSVGNMLKGKGATLEKFLRIEVGQQ